MLTFITILIALDCILLIGVVLIQNPKGGGVDSTFGGQSANQMFGAARSADFVEKLTWWLAGILIALCIVAAIMSSASGNIGNSQPGEETPTEQPAEQPVQPPTSDPK
ncbi:MAG: preprotein translocase subunit SecG [Saprospiraceae bacterium]|nr:preprotein translocase subunit SecG [Saprospiraceae bacterium]MBK8451494.1 preprotein translocase subunit SecG [Saprospiraceae bacterium]MBK8483450.1 preprotein translocase subunit SecG [Saprospiraceae bacterium]MBK9220960.1 preprotein translocase subunit SecG [Saprospiraceae bacterium]MBK9722195.1 preprotein translocase subunit SecG [Saprospiraceae bacterium]